MLASEVTSPTLATCPATGPSRSTPPDASKEVCDCRQEYENQEHQGQVGQNQQHEGQEHEGQSRCEEARLAKETCVKQNDQGEGW